MAERMNKEKGFDDRLHIPFCRFNYFYFFKSFFYAARIS